MSLDAPTDSDPRPQVVGKAGELGRYRLIAELARGGMGIVYLALVKASSFHKLLVVKELKPHLAEDPQLLRMFEDEGRLAARLSHPNVVQTIEVGSEGEHHYIVMEYLDGQTLHRVVSRARQRGAALPLALHIHVLIDALRGLHYAHELTDYDGTPLNVVHRDVSPQNVFVTYDGHVKVVDFGIAKAMDSSTETRTGVLKGKVAYLAPEQAQGLRVDRRADVFAVGAMLFHAIAGRRLWEGQNDMQILTALVHGRIPSIREWVADVPEQLLAVLDRALAVEPTDRYPSAIAMASDLEAYLEGAHERAGAQQLATMLSELFAEDRKRIKSLVEDQVKSARVMATSEFRAMDMLSVPAAVSGAFSASGESDPSNVSIPHAQLGITPTNGGGTRSPIAASLAPGAAKAPNSRALLWAGLALAVMGLVVGGVFYVSSRNSTGTAVASSSHAARPRGSAGDAPATAAASAGVGAAPSATAAAAASVTVDVRVTPTTASLLVDGKRVGNPFHGSLSGGEKHAIRAEAPGYASDERTIEGTANERIDIALMPERAVGLGARVPKGGTGKAGSTTAGTGTAIAPTEPTAAPSAAETTPKKPTREIDRENPFGT